MKKYIILLLLSVVLGTSCSESPVFDDQFFVVAFKETSGTLLDIENEKTIELIYSEKAYDNSNITIQITAENALYGRDFITIPEAINNEISLSILENETENSFQIIELNDAFTDVMKITFTISSIELEGSNIQGNTSYQLSDTMYLGGSFLPSVGGPNEPNQVYIDLSSNKETVVKRDTWDLGFYSGDEFRVVINGSLYMAAAALSTTDINSVNSSNLTALQSSVAVGTFNPDNEAYIDAPNGNILETAIDEVYDDETKNLVYLVNLGAEIGTATPTTGSAAVAGDTRGWKKIRVLKNNDDYTLQYADLDATSYTEITVPKNLDYNFSFFSFSTQSIVDIEPQKTQWDICFTVFTNLIDGAGSYGFSDYVIHNRKGEVTAYALTDSTTSYNDFSINNIDQNLLEASQTVIGSTWRDVFSGTVTSNIFYILKDSSNNYYKIRFLDLVNDSGERGYPRFEYAILQ